MHAVEFRLRVAVVLTAAGLGLGAIPAHASLNDQFVCETGDERTITVTIMATDPGKAVLTQNATPSAQASQITLTGDAPGRAFRFDRGAIRFMGSATTGFLYLAGEQLLCRFPGEPDAEMSQASDPSLPSVMADGEGLLVRRYDLGVDEALAFGMPSEALTSYLGRYLGSPGPLTRNEECGAGPMQFRRFGPLQVSFQDERFVGWMIQPDRRGDGAVAVSLRDGTRPGDPAEMVTDRFGRIDGSTLGAEYHRDGINALVDEDAGVIEWLMAGANCTFR